MKSSPHPELTLNPFTQLPKRAKAVENPKTPHFQISTVLIHPNPTILIPRSAYFNPIGPIQNLIHYIYPPTTVSNLLISHLSSLSRFASLSFIELFFLSLSNFSLSVVEVIIILQNQWRVGAKLSDLEPPRRPSLGAARLVSNSPLGVSLGSSRPASTPSVSVPELRFTSLPSSNTLPPRFLNSPEMQQGTTRRQGLCHATFSLLSETTRSSASFLVM